MTIAEQVLLWLEQLRTLVLEPANKIITGRGGTASRTLAGIPAAIETIPSDSESPEIDLSEITATSEQVLEGYTYLGSDGVAYSGTMVHQKGVLTLDPSGGFIPKGYYDGTTSYVVSSSGVGDAEEDLTESLDSLETKVNTLHETLLTKAEGSGASETSE